MARSHHLNLIDFMAAIAAGALPRYLLRYAWLAPWYVLLMVAAPLAGALLQRSRGGRGITGGAVGGVAVLGYLAGCQAVAFGPEWRHLGLLLFGGAFGATPGLATWALAGLGRWFAPRRPPG